MKINEIIDEILLTIWLETYYAELRKICESITKRSDIDDLLHSCILQFQMNKRVADLTDEQRLYFFTGVVRNNYYSKTSPYAKQYKRFVYDVEYLDIDIADNDYEESPFNMEWVNKELKKLPWYFKRIFELYIEEGCSLIKLSRRTTIPINSVSRDIRYVRTILRNERERQKNI